jgi:PAS domain S-box-containing protein
VNSEFEQLTGYSREEAEGKMSWTQFAHPDDLERIKDYHKKRRIDPASAPRNYTARMHDRNGVIKTLHTVVAVISGTKKSIASFVDISEQKKSEEALEQVNRKLNLLSSITRHDINNQVTVILGYLEMLEQKQSEPSLKGYFKTLTTAARRISVMIRFTKEYEYIGVKAPLWQDCRILIDRAAGEASLGKTTVKNDLPAKIEVFADPLIVKVFYNLIDNAVSYGGKITTIRFSFKENGDDALIICTDDGNGIPVEDKERIFERGFGKNSGLGLTLSREILAITDIIIHETGEPGKGARFEITVPKGAWRLADTKE